MGFAPDPSNASRGRYWAVLVPLWALSLLYVWSALRYGWIPHDEGTLAQAAWRVALGELPHRDFDEVYTGGLSWLNAAAFRVFGESLWSMRIALFAVFALWVPALFWIATRFAAPLVAAPFVALCVTWSVPIYVAPMPSWYVLFLATFGTAAILKYRACGCRWWLAAAGICAGLAITVKITGLHFVAAALLFFAWREPAITSANATPGSGPSRFYPIAMTLALVAFVAALLKQVWAFGLAVGGGGLPGEIEHFVLPGAALSVLVGRRIWTGSRASALVRFRALLGLALPFLAGLAIPLGVLALRYVLAGALDRLIEGVLILPGRRVGLPTASTPPPDLTSAAWVLPLVALAAIPPSRGRRWPAVLLVAAGVLVLGAIALAIAWEPAFWKIHTTPRHLMPLLALVGAWWLRKPERAGPAADDAFLLIAAAAMVSLVQFPFTVPIYFFYFAPLMVLATLALTSLRPTAARDRYGLLLAVGGMIVFMLAAPMRIGMRGGWEQGTRLETARSGLDMWIGDVREYDQVIALLGRHAEGGWTWAGPDAPEVPFLAGLRNPTRTIFELFDADVAASPASRAESLVRALESRGVTAIARNKFPSFSGQLPEETLSALRVHFPNEVLVGKFIVAWRE